MSNRNPISHNRQDSLVQALAVWLREMLRITAVKCISWKSEFAYELEICVSKPE